MKIRYGARGAGIGLGQTSSSIFCAGVIDEGKPINGTGQEIDGIGIGFEGCAGKSNFIVIVVECLFRRDLTNESHIGYRGEMVQW